MRRPRGGEACKAPPYPVTARISPTPRPAGDLRRLQTIADQAEGLALDRFGFDPVDPAQILDDIPDLTWSQGDYGECFDGLIEYDGRDFHIYANRERFSRADAGRGAFTLGHELGHYFIDEHRLWLKANPHRSHCSFIFQSTQDSGIHEREADVFACNLLLPAASFRKRVRCPCPGADVILDTAAYFRTSITSTAIRFCELEPFPCAIIKWSEAGACQWTRLSPRVHACFPSVARTLDGMRAASATVQALAAGATDTTLRTATSTAEAWFPRVEDILMHQRVSLDQQWPVITEHAIPLGRYGVLTVLSCHAWINLPAVASTETPTRG